MLVPVHWLLKISRHPPARRVLQRKSTYFHSVFELCNKNISFCWLKLDSYFCAWVYHTLYASKFSSLCTLFLMIYVYIYSIYIYISDFSVKFIKHMSFDKTDFISTQTNLCLFMCIVNIFAILFG